MKREYIIGNKINDWTVISEPFYVESKQKVKLKCKCGRECTFDVRTVNRARFSTGCKGCGQIERHKKNGRIYEIGDILMNLKILKIYSSKKTLYQVECLSCGSIYITGHDTLNKKKNNKGVPYCKNCFRPEHKTKKVISMCTPHISFSYYQILNRQADLRGIEFTVTPEYLEKIFNGYCYISGLPIKIGTHSTINGIKDLGTASLDRIDSSLGYIEGNVAWCYKKINVMKHTSSINEFLALCKIIAEHNK